MKPMFKTGIDLFDNLVGFINGSSNIYVYTPYIKLATLKHLINQTPDIKAVFVRWEPRDLILGASDLAIYPYLKERNITLYRNPRLHLKAVVANYSSVFIGSANISQRALNWPETANYNYELATIVNDLSLEDRLYFSMIETESILITDQIYEQIQSQMAEKEASFPSESDFELNIRYPDKDFYISSLPLTYSVETLLRVYETKEAVNDIERNCLTHDLALYRISFGLSPDELRRQLKVAFFAHPFIRAFLENLDDVGEIYFGQAKDWIHRNCSDVPLPRKWEITENIQILYRWIVKLGDGIYNVDRPSYSERLFLKA